MEIEARQIHSLEGGDQNREVIGQAAGHHGIDGEGVQRQLETGRRVRRDDRLGRPAFEGQHRGDPIDGRRHDRQTIGPALRVAVVDGGEQVVGDVVDAGGIERHRKCSTNPKRIIRLERGPET